MSDISNNEELIKKLIGETKAKGINKPLNEADIREKIKAIDKNEVIRKLNSMGLGSIANALRGMSDDDILREISKNPGILRKLNSFLK